MKVIGISHVTIKVTDLNRSIDFYCRVLQMDLRHRGNKDAYLEWGSS
ncbi:VOC family protein [Paenibacillus sp. YYML68]|nr:VOC family protein [Paenibacillus sp. YYML68]